MSQTSRSGGFWASNLRVCGGCLRLETRGLALMADVVWNMLCSRGSNISVKFASIIVQTAPFNVQSCLRSSTLKSGINHAISICKLGVYAGPKAIVFAPSAQQICPAPQKTRVNPLLMVSV